MEDDLCNRYFTKLPGDLGKTIHEEYIRLYGHLPNLGIGPRITFVFNKLEGKCKEATIQEQIKR